MGKSQQCPKWKLDHTSPSNQIPSILQDCVFRCPWWSCFPEKHRRPDTILQLCLRARGHHRGRGFEGRLPGVGGWLRFALSHVQDSFDDPLGFHHNNSTATLVVLQAIREYAKIQRFIHISTDEVYGQTEGAAAKESCALRPTKPDSASKAAAEMSVKAYMATALEYQPSLLEVTMCADLANTHRVSLPQGYIHIGSP